MVTLHEVITFLVRSEERFSRNAEIGRAVQQECRDRKSGSAGMPRPISYAVFCLKKKKQALKTSRRSASTCAQTEAKESDQRCCCCPRSFSTTRYKSHTA